ncbi:ABC transporter ATP-binding protein [Patulibacter defluvii]|uniref:ABC transporter ATP-binding protein n=1 Tax=Patulibacter defluvii TaxID=3095358 RepID=UPI002A757070|nr:ABC transporter ATP-binding protein [Patulibacter sp. DM4]
MNALEIRGLDAGYGRVRVLHDVGFDVAPGAVTLLLGANGAGKTTTLRAISGLLPCDGRVAVDGTDVRGWSVHRIVAQGVAHVPQDRGTLATLTVEENLRLGAYRRRDGEVAADVERWYGFFPRLGERRRQKAGTLSGGEQQMLAIGRALMSRPKVLLLDEPSQGLAPLVVQGIFAALGELKADSETAMLMVEQNAGLGLDLADHALVMDAGSIVFSGSPSALRTDDRLARIYLGGHA